MLFIPLINVKMPTIVGILSIMSRKNFMLYWDEHDKSFITSGPGYSFGIFTLVAGNIRLLSKKRPRLGLQRWSICATTWLICQKALPLLNHVEVCFTRLPQKRMMYEFTINPFKCTNLQIYYSHFFHKRGAPVAQWVKRWPTDLAVTSSIPARDRIFSSLNGVPLHTAFIINLLSSWYDWNTIEKDVKSQVIHPSIFHKRSFSSSSNIT